VLPPTAESRWVGARPGAAPPVSGCPAVTRPAVACPAGTNPAGANPAAAAAVSAAPALMACPAAAPVLRPVAAQVVRGPAARPAGAPHAVRHSSAVPVAARRAWRRGVVTMRSDPGTRKAVLNVWVNDRRLCQVASNTAGPSGGDVECGKPYGGSCRMSYAVRRVTSNVASRPAGGSRRMRHARPA
jgi:hypothetical protein